MSRSYWAGVARVLRIPDFRRIEREIDDELHFHLDARVAELMAAGHSKDDAREMARAEFGDLEASRRELAEVDRRLEASERRAGVADALRQDISYALRGFRRQPGLAIGVALTLAIAVGANAAVFTLIDPLLFRVPPGLTDASAMRRLYTNHPNSPNATNGRSVWRIVSYAEFRAIRTALHGLARTAVFVSRDSVPVTRGPDSAFAAVSYVTADFLPMLSRASRGRFFTEAEDDVHNAADVAVVSERFVRRHFAGEADPVGKTIALAGKQYTIIGVAGGGFEGIEWSAVDAWVPFSTNPRLALDAQPWYDKGGVFLPLVVRLSPGVGDAVVAAKASLAYSQSYRGNEPSQRGRAILVGPLAEARGPVKATQEVAISTRLAVVAGIVLLIASANVANLLLARAMGRRRETALRLALGISRRRLASQLLVEALLLAVIAAAGALLVGRWTGGALRAALLPRVEWIGSPIDARVVAFVVLLTMIASLAAAVVPALLASRQNLIGDLSVGRSDSVPHKSPLRATLLIVQTALSMMLLVGAGLFVRSLGKVNQIEMGFDTDRLVIASAYFPDEQRHPERGTIFPELAARLRTTPGITGTAYGAGAPLYSWYSSVPLFVPDRDSAITTPQTRAQYIGVSSEYFAVAGTRIESGRGFLASDVRGSTRVMVIGATMARTFWPGQSPLGKCVSPNAKTTPCYTVVGVAEDVHGFRRLEDTGVQFYLPITQMPNERTLPNALMVRAGAMTASSVAMLVRAEMVSAFPGASITSRDALSALAPELRPWMLGAQLFAALGFLALVVAAIGVYSVVAFAARRRTHEIGVRMALGARAPALMRLVVAQGTGVVGIGIILGALGAILAGRFVSALLHGVSPRDPLSMGAAAVTLLAVGVIASLGPAVRSSRVDPMVVLRHD